MMMRRPMRRGRWWTADQVWQLLMGRWWWIMPPAPGWDQKIIRPASIATSPHPPSHPPSHPPPHPSPPSPSHPFPRPLCPLPRQINCHQGEEETSPSIYCNIKVFQTLCTINDHILHKYNLLWSNKWRKLIPYQILGWIDLLGSTWLMWDTGKILPSAVWPWEKA